MSCTWDEAVDEIVARLTPALDGLPVKWPNAPDPKRDDDKLWARVSIVEADSNRGSIGARRQVNDGILYVQFIMPLGGGMTGVYGALQPTLDALVDHKTPKGVWFRKVGVIKSGDEDETKNADAHFVKTVRADFTFDEVRKR